MLVAILAMSLAGQLQVDRDYRPKPGDRAILGLHITDSDGPRREYVMRAECFSTIEGVRASASNDDEEGRLLDTEPDAYSPRVGTHVEVIDTQRFSYMREGKAQQGRAFRVKLLDGEFKGKSFFVRGSNILRLVGDPERPGSDLGRRRQGPSRGARTAPRRPGPDAGDLVLTDLVTEPNEVTKFVSISGRLRNASSRTLKSVLVDVMVEDGAGKMIQSTPAFCLPTTLEPGEEGTFQTIVKLDPAAAGVKLNFKDVERSIPWADKSGKDAHR